MNTYHQAAPDPTGKLSGPFPPNRRSSFLATVTTVVCFALSLVLLLLGCGLMIAGLLSLPGTMFVGHTNASGLIVLLGSISLFVAVAVLGVPLVIIGRRQRW